MSIVINKKMSIEEMLLAIGKLPSGKTFKAKKHCGVLKLQEDPLKFQKGIRDEWE